jgi:hypothetical protein
MPVPFEIEYNLVRVGLVANDGTGDDLREAFLKINGNFLYLGNRLGTAPSGANLGPAGESVFKEVVDFQYRFRKINADGNLHVRLVGDVITLDFRPNSAVNFLGQNITNAGAVTATSFAGLLTGNVTGNVSGNAGTVTNGFYTSSSFNLGTTSITVNRASAVQTLTGVSIDGNAGTVTNGVYTTGDQTIGGVKTFNSAVNADLIGDVTGVIRTTGSDAYVDVSDLERRINTFDYGVINPVFMDPIRYFLYVVGTDMGTFNNPSEFSIDAGTI